MDYSATWNLTNVSVSGSTLYDSYRAIISSSLLLNPSACACASVISSRFILSTDSMNSGIRKFVMRTVPGFTKLRFQERIVVVFEPFRMSSLYRALNSNMFDILGCRDGHSKDAVHKPFLSIGSRI